MTWVTPAVRRGRTGIKWLLLLPVWQRLWRAYSAARERLTSRRERRSIERAGRRARQAADRATAERVRADQQATKEAERAVRTAARVAAEAAEKSARARAREQAEADVAGMTLTEYKDVVRREEARKAEQHAKKAARDAEKRANKVAQNIVRKRVLTDKERRETMKAIEGRPAVIVRKYISLPFRPADKAFAEDATTLAQFGYFPTSQSFAANNVLTGIAVGTGDLTVAYTRRTT